MPSLQLARLRFKTKSVNLTKIFLWFHAVCFFQSFGTQKTCFLVFIQLLCFTQCLSEKKMFSLDYNVLVLCIRQGMWDEICFTFLIVVLSTLCHAKQLDWPAVILSLKENYLRKCSVCCFCKNIFDKYVILYIKYLNIWFMFALSCAKLNHKHNLLFHARHMPPQFSVTLIYLRSVSMFLFQCSKLFNTSNNLK